MLSVPSMMIVAEVRTRRMRGRVRTRAFLERGGRDITEGSTGSTPRDWAGGPSIRISGSRRQWTTMRKESMDSLLIQRICMALRGFLKRRMVLSRTRESAATLVLS